MRSFLVYVMSIGASNRLYLQILIRNTFYCRSPQAGFRLDSIPFVAYHPIFACSCNSRVPLHYLPLTEGTLHKNASPHSSAISRMIRFSSEQEAMRLITARTAKDGFAFRTNVSIARIICIYPRTSFITTTPTLTYVACSATPPTCLFFT